jgi:hypothetical protein
MDDEQRLVSQAAMTKALNPASHVFVYRNLVRHAVAFYSVSVVSAACRT